MSGTRPEDWDRAAKKWYQRGRVNVILTEHKRQTYTRLLKRWGDVPEGSAILKTDLFAEACDIEYFLLDIPPARVNIVGIDLSGEVVSLAKRQANNHGIDGRNYLCCDVRDLPFRDDSFALVISDSSLDHFPSEKDLVAALRELRRVLLIGGSLILTLDNKNNLTYPPYFIVRLWMWLGLAPYFIGKTISLNRLRPIMEELGFDIEETTAIFHYPHPDALVRGLEHSVHKLGRGKLDNAIRKGLCVLDKLEGTGIKYITGRYIAVHARKRRQGP